MATKAAQAAQAQTKTFISVVSKKEGFRRGGRAWSETPTIVDASDFTEAQQAQLANEMMLIIVPARPPEEADTEGDAKE